MSAQTDLRGTDLRDPSVPGPLRVGPGRGARPASPRPVAAARFLGRHSVVLACLASLAVHLLSLSRQLGPDEGGFTMVAQHWRQAGPYLYGPSWVDRPPGLIALFAAAQHLGPYGVRLTAAVLAVVMVGALASAARTLGGHTAARWTAWTAFAFASSTLLETERLNGELAAATLVAVSIAALVRAVWPSSPARRPVEWAVLSGAAAAGAVLMKQNFVDGFAFAAVLLVACLATRANRATHRTPVVVAGMAAFVSGAVAVLIACLLWTLGNGGPTALAYAMFGFRSDAAAVMASWSWAAPQQRLGILLQIAVLSGLLLLVAPLAVSHARGLGRIRPLPWAVAATVAVEVVGVVGGGNFWNHYLIGLIPGVSLAAGLGARRWSPGRRWTQALVALSVAVTALTAPVTAWGAAHQTSRAYATGTWIAAAAEPGDTITVPFTHANVIQASGLTPGYPYAWSLPVRTLDPDLSLLTSTLAGPDAPTWVVRWDNPHTWGLDPASQVDAALQAHYRVAAVVCGHAVWLRDGVDRPLAPTPSAAACGVDAG